MVRARTGPLTANRIRKRVWKEPLTRSLGWLGAFQSTVPESYFMKLSFLLLFSRFAPIGALVGAFCTASAQSIVTWTSPTETTFAGPNWDIGVPADDLTSHIARFSSADLADPFLTASRRVAGLAIGTPLTFGATDGAVLTVGSSNIAISNVTGEVLVGTALAGAASLTKTGAGALALSGANTYSGGTTATAGRLNIAHASALGSGTFTLNGSSFDNTSGAALTLSTNNAIVVTAASNVFAGTHSLNLGAGTVMLSGGVKTFDVTASTLTMGAVGGAGSLRKFGAGALVINGDTSFASTLTVSAGTVTLAGSSTRTGMNIVNLTGGLNINHASALGTGSLSFNGTAIRLDNTSGAAIVLTTNNAQTWNSDFTFIGTHSLDLGTGLVTMINPRKITVNGSTLTVGGIKSTGASLTKLGGGTLVLSGGNLYTGTTSVNAGTLLINGSLSDESMVTVNTGGTLGGAGTISGPTTIASGGTLAPGAGTGLLTFGHNLTLADGSSTVFQIGGTARGITYDAIDLTAGALTYGGAFGLEFVTTLAGGTTFNLFGLFADASEGYFSSVLASGSYSGAFTNADGVWTLVNGAQTLLFDQGAGTLFVSGAAVPEAETCAVLFGLAALGFVVVRRRRLRAPPGL